jgi:hypothetical protein
MKSDLAGGIAIIAVAVLLYAGGGLAPLWGPGANRAASFWPLSMLALLALLGAALAMQALRKKQDGAVPPPTARGAAPRQLVNAILVLSYLPALLLVGFHVSALAYAFVLPPVLGGVRWRASAAFAVGFSAVLFLVFSVGLRMDLPRGWLLDVLR